MPICTICGENMETVTKCTVCGAKFCVDCGDPEEKLCIYCIDEEEDDWDDEEEEDEWDDEEEEDEWNS